jgi:hypothetical protein
MRSNSAPLLPGAYRAEWFSGRRDSMFAQQIRLQLAYCRALKTTELTVWRRYTCLRAIRPIPFAAWYRERNISPDQAARLTVANESARSFPAQR